MTATERPNSTGWSRSRLIRFALLAVAVSVAIFAAIVGPVWAATMFGWLSRSAQRHAILGFLHTLLVGYLVFLGLSLVGVGFSCRAILLARRLRRPITRSARVLALCATVLIGLLLMEAGAAWRLARLRTPTPLPTRFANTKPAGEIHIVVIGESSAEGQPYQPRLSIGQIVAWRLEQHFPGRKVRLQMFAAGGICLEQAVDTLFKLQSRPDAILVFAGHNEFQARAEWSRIVGHYVDEESWSNRPAEDLPLAKWSALCRTILQTIDRQRIDKPPPSFITREVVDHPVVSPGGYEFLCAEFHRQVERLAAYCDQIGAIPIMVVPASNDGRTPPYRSVLAADASSAQRVDFAREFLAARAIERTDPRRAEATYRAFVDRRPEFAESHYRLAQLLERAGRWDEANAHYDLARDLDAYPMRCPSDFRSGYYETARRHPSVLLIDGPRVLAALAPHGILTFNQYHDPQHPTFLSHLALAQNALDQLRDRRAFGWPSGEPSPRIDPVNCARRFGLDGPVWADVLLRSSGYYGRTAFIRYDPDESLRRAKILFEASRAVAAGADPETTGIPGVGARTTALELDPDSR